MRNQRRILLLAVLCSVLLSLVPARAQERQPEIAVLHTAAQPEPGAAALPLSIFFTLRDQNGDIVPRSEVSLDGARGSLIVTPFEDEPFPPLQVTVSDPETPIKIALVIDRSGSMNQQVGDGASQPRSLDAVVRDAAVESIKSAPEQAEFAVFSFAEKPELQSGGFLRRSDQSQLIEDAIRRFDPNPPGTGNTCITDAALAAIDYLNAGEDGQGVERKAVILFTDGLDKEADNRPGNGNNCSNLDFAAVIRSAQLSAGTIIPLYTIWPCTEPCNEQQRAGLENLARETRGASAIGSLEDVNALFQRVMELLNSQWVVKADVVARAGQNTATLQVQPGDGAGLLTAATSFESDRDYNPLPQLTVAQQLYDTDQDRYRVTLGITNPGGVSQVIAGVYNLESGGTLIPPEQRFDNPGPRLDFDLTTDGLRSGETYFLRISAQGRDGQAIRDPSGQPLLVTYQFVYEPRLNYTIGAVTPAWEEERLVVAVDVRGAGQRTLNFTGEVINRDSGEREALEATTPRDGELRFPLPRLLREATRPASYEIALRLEDGENMLERRTDPAVTIAPPERPSGFAQFMSSPVGPVALGLLGLALFAAVGGFVYMRSRPRKREIPLPFNPQTMLRQPTVVPSKPSSETSPAAPPAQAKGTAAVQAQPPATGSAPAQAKPLAAGTSPAQPSPPLAPPTEVRPARPVAPPTVLHSTSEATELHVPERKVPRVRVKVLKTVDPAQLREQIVELPCTIGREQAGFTITGDTKISRLHAELRVEGGQLLLIDLKSTNGTSVRDQQLEKGGSAPAEGPTAIGIGPNTTVEVELL